MNIEFIFENPHHNWSVLHVFKKYYEWFISQHNDINISYKNSSEYYDGNPSGIYSPHNLVITNLDTKKCIVVSYWDRPIEMTWKNNGWNDRNIIEIICSSGTSPEMGFTPFSYLPYLTNFDELSLNSKKMNDKTNNELEFKGFLYGERLNLSKLGRVKITDDKISPVETYFNYLTNNKICLSLNGAGEICNRDMEILSSRSVLLRPNLTLEFHNKLIPNYHYISFEYSSDPQIQSQNIIDKFNEIKDNNDLLNFISENGYNWYLENGMVNSNVEILKKIININKLK
jgi:hypothetical protein